MSSSLAKTLVAGGLESPAAAGVPSPQTSPVSRGWCWLVLGTILAGVIFRFAYLDRKVYWHDEAITSLWFSGCQVDEVRQGLGDRETSVPEVLQYQRVNPERGVSTSLRALARDDAQHPPLYYGLVRVWAGWLGDSVATVRLFSAVLSLLAFPCLYWLARELFETPATAWASVALLAVSPFHVLYAQEAREYSLLTIAVLLSSAALLRALRVQTKLAWALYAPAVALGLYTSHVFVTVVVAHGVYVIGVSRPAIRREALHWPKAMSGYLLATLAGVLAFVPWVLVVLTTLTHIRQGLAWLTEDESLYDLFRGWCLCLSSVFFDPLPERGDRLALALRVPIALLALGSLGILCRTTRSKTWLFILTLVGATALTTVVPDLVLGGQRSTVPRFALPGLVAVQLAVAHLIAAGITSPSSWQKRLGMIVLLGLLVSGVGSDVVSARAVRWWNKGKNNLLPGMAVVINQAPRPLVLSASGSEHLGNVLALSHLLEPRARLWLMGDPTAPAVPDGFSDVFLFKPSPALIQQFEAAGYEVEMTPAPGLRRLQYRGAAAVGGGPDGKRSGVPTPD